MPTAQVRLLPKGNGTQTRRDNNPQNTIRSLSKSSDGDVGEDREVIKNL